MPISRHDQRNAQSSKPSRRSRRSRRRGSAVPSTHVLAQRRYYRPGLEALEQRCLLAFDVVGSLFVNDNGLRLVVDFNGPVDAASVEAGDLLIDGTPAATEVTVVDNETISFLLPSPEFGSHALDIPAGAIRDVFGGEVSSHSTTLSLPLIVQNDTFIAATAEPVVLNVLANDWDVEGDPLSVVAVSTPIYGTVVINPDNTLSYTRPFVAQADDTFTYTVSDGQGNTATATVTVYVPATGVFPSPDYRQGERGYFGASDTYVDNAASGANHAAEATVIVDGDNPTAQGLLRFDYILGFRPTQSYPVQRILSAHLELNITDGGSPLAIHRMVVPWDAAGATWDSLGDGIQIDGSEALALPEAVTMGAVLSPGWVSIDVTQSAIAWQANPESNFGWMIRSTGPDSVAFHSAEATLSSFRPVLSVVVAIEQPPPIARDDYHNVVPGQITSIPVLLNDSPAPEQQSIRVTSVTQPAHGTASIGEGGRTVYYDQRFVSPYSGPDSFTYTIGGVRPATATVYITSGGLYAKFVQGEDGYTGTVDTYVDSNAPNTSFASAEYIEVDGADPGNAWDRQGLLRFEGIFGTNLGQIPPGAAIQSASLQLHTRSISDHIWLHRMLEGWSDTDTYDSRGAGIQLNGREAEDYADATSYNGDAVALINGLHTIDVLASVVAWHGDPTKNFGWAIITTGSRAGSFESSSGGIPPLKLQKPRLYVTYTLEQQPPKASDDAGTILQDQHAVIPILRNDHDPNGESLVAHIESPPQNGQVYLNVGQSATYVPAPGFVGTDTFTYTVVDESGGAASAVVSVTVLPTMVSIDQGISGYVHSASPTRAVGTSNLLMYAVDSSTNKKQGLLRFDGIFGSEFHQVPAHAVIQSAILQYVTNDGDHLRFHRMIGDWSTSSTYNSLVNGIQADGVEADVAFDATTDDGVAATLAVGFHTLDMLDRVVQWQSDPSSNKGWAILPTGPDEVGIHGLLSNNTYLSPKLTVNYTLAPRRPTASDDQPNALINTPIVIDATANDLDPDGDALSIQAITPPSHGTAVLNANQTISYVPDTDFVGTDSFMYFISDGNGGFAAATITVSVVPEPLQVAFLLPTDSGFVTQLSRPLTTGDLNLYDQGGTFGPADVTLIGATVGAVLGSLAVNAAGDQITFLKTGGPLAPDTYTLTLRSAVNAFHDGDNLLDGNADGTPGDDYVTTFTVNPLAQGVVTATIPDFARGHGQEVNLWNSAGQAAYEGIPVLLSSGVGVREVAFTIHYDPALLEIDAVKLGGSVAVGTTLDYAIPSPGTINITVVNPTADLSSATSPFALLSLLRADTNNSGQFLPPLVPAAAPYGGMHVLDIADLTVSGPGDAPLAAVADDGVHVAAYPGEMNGSGTYNAPDTSILQRLILNPTTAGLIAYPLTDPLILADINANGSVQASDVSQVQRLILNLASPFVPPRPTEGSPLAAPFQAAMALAGNTPAVDDGATAASDDGEVIPRSNAETLDHLALQAALWATLYQNHAYGGHDEPEAGTASSDNAVDVVHSQSDADWFLE